MEGEVWRENVRVSSTRGEPNEILYVIRVFREYEVINVRPSKYEQ